MHPSDNCQTTPLPEVGDAPASYSSSFAMMSGPTLSPVSLLCATCAPLQSGNVPLFQHLRAERSGTSCHNEHTGNGSLRAYLQKTPFLPSNSDTFKMLTTCSAYACR